MFNNDSRKAFNFFKGENFGFRQPHHAFSGHAICAPKVATIGHRDPEIANGSTVRVNQIFDCGRR
jgi:hypothetical protein